MSRSSIPAALVGSWILLISSCSLISLDQLNVTSYPAGRNQVIGRDERITLAFSIPPDRVDAEALARILTPGGPAQVDHIWEGDLLVLVPAPALPMGERLVLSLSGDLAMEDGREFSVSVEVPFFVGTSGPRPRLLACQPADGAAAGTRTALVLSFNRPMDGSSFADGFTLNPDTDVDTEWSPDYSTVTMTPSRQWENLTLYTWQVDASVTDRTGVGLGVPSSGCFFTQIDAVPPSVLSLRPAAANPDGTFTVVEQPLDGNIRVRDCILLSFSEDVTMESLQRAFRLDPSVGGSFTREQAGDFYFVPARPWAMATRYHLVVSTDVQDLSGQRHGRGPQRMVCPRHSRPGRALHGSQRGTCLRAMLAPAHRRDAHRGQGGGLCCRVRTASRTRRAGPGSPLPRSARPCSRRRSLIPR